MEDPSEAWPYWKFGLKKEDLNTKLHEQYNTIPSAIQDPEAFHHDVLEISLDADTIDDFHRRLALRKQQRLRELDESLEIASFEIIGNPALINTEQWQYALQLFRTRSLDSLVRYFSSYLPHDNIWSHENAWSEPDTASETGSSVVDSNGTSDTDDHDDESVMSDHSSLEKTHDAFIGPKTSTSSRSMAMCSGSSVAPTTGDTKHQDFQENFTSVRHASISESETDRLVFHLSRSDTYDDDFSQADTPITSISELDNAGFYRVVELVDRQRTIQEVGDYHAAKSCGTQSMVLGESGTPIPRIEQGATHLHDATHLLPHRRHRSASPQCSRPLSRVESTSGTYGICHHGARSSRQRRREDSPPCKRWNGHRFGSSISPSRVHKTLPESSRLRHRGRG